MLLTEGGMRVASHAAFRWLGIAAATDLAGINMLGRCYEMVEGVADNRTRAMALLRRAASQSRLGAIQLRHDADA
jgi:TPR repeat protein